MSGNTENQDPNGTPTGSGDNSGAQTPAQGTGQQSPQTPPGGAAGEQERTFSQVDVDRIVGERARRASQAAVSELLQDLGIEDLDGLRETVQAHRAAKEAQMTELERAQARIQELDAERKRLETENRTRMLETEVITVATSLGFRNPRDGVALADLSAVTIGDDGKVTGVEDALKALLESRPYLKGEAAPPPAPDIDGNRGTGNGPGGEQPTYQHLQPPALRNRGQ